MHHPQQQSDKGVKKRHFEIISPSSFLLFVVACACVFARVRENTAYMLEIVLQHTQYTSKCLTHSICHTQHTYPHTQHKIHHASLQNTEQRTPSTRKMASMSPWYKFSALAFSCACACAQQTCKKGHKSSHPQPNHSWHASCNTVQGNSSVLSQMRSSTSMHARVQETRCVAACSLPTHLGKAPELLLQLHNNTAVTSSSAHALFQPTKTCCPIFLFYHVSMKHSKVCACIARV